VEHVAVPLARAHAPALLLISAGFDAHARDPLAGCRVTTAGYAAMVASVRRVAEELDVPVGLVLEGGYDLGVLAESLTASLAVLGAEEVPATDVPVHPLAHRAAERLAGHWPALVG
jgi:acetoin utilization deacetylase AcuC-like enzyme